MPLSHASANPILVPQPPSSLGSVTAFAKHPSQRPKVFGRPPSTYIASVPSYLALPPGKTDGQPNQSNTDGSDISTRPLLYALSSESYPLVNIAPIPRPGALVDGLFVMSDELPYHEQLLPYLLDPPAEDSTPAVTDEEGKSPLSLPRQTYSMKLWWIFGVLCSMLVIGGTVTRWYRQTSVKQSASPTEERSSLLAEMEVPVLSEKTVDIVEAESSINANSSDNLGPLDDVESTPKKKTNRRRVRGKKKKGDAPSVSFAVEGDDDEDEDKGEGSSNPSPVTSPPATVLKKDEKPLPELPKVMTATDLVDAGEVDRLNVTDIELGKFIGTILYLRSG